MSLEHLLHLHLHSPGSFPMLPGPVGQAPRLRLQVPSDVPAFPRSSLAKSRTLAPILPCSIFSVLLPRLLAVIGHYL